MSEVSVSASLSSVSRNPDWSVSAKLTITIHGSFGSAYSIHPLITRAVAQAAESAARGWTYGADVTIYVVASQPCGKGDVKLVGEAACRGLAGIIPQAAIYWNGRLTREPRDGD